MKASQKYDVVILGTGPAGLQAAIHAARRKVSVLVLGKESKSSLYSAHIENFCCLFKVSGEEMLKTGRIQAANFGTEFLEEDVLHITSEKDFYLVETEGGKRIETKTLIVATGTYRNKLRVPGEKELLGKGVSYCVDCDGNFFRGETVAVVGNESAAVDGAITLSEIAGEVHLIADTIEVSDTLVAKLGKSRVIHHSGVKVTKILGGEKVTGLGLDDGSRVDVSGVFIELGAKGLMELATSLGIQLDDEMQYIRTDKKQTTNLPGVFAAGDICGPPWQMAKAVGEGCVAGIEAASYVKRSRSRH
jgi:thioredoxin reductase (NADPH)